MPIPVAVKVVPTLEVPAPISVKSVMLLVTNATPDPLPTPVAVKVVPTSLSAAPIAVKSVVPVDVIVYEVLVTKLPAVTEVPVDVIVYELSITNEPAVTNPESVAVNTVPTLLSVAPINVKFVRPISTLPVLLITYLVPIANTPALTVAVAPALALTLKSFRYCPVGLPPGPVVSSALPVPLVAVSSSQPLCILTIELVLSVETL